LQFRYRGSRRESAVAQLFSLGGSHITMKKTYLIPLIPLGLLALYFALYIAVRLTNHGTVTVTSADTAGGFHTNSFDAVCFLAPVSGFERHTEQVMYGAFYPMGKLDHLMTGRRYEFMDMRDAPIIKPTP
jgi:hypothetical protein